MIIRDQIHSNQRSKREQYGRYGSEPTFRLHSRQRFLTKPRNIIARETRGN